MPGSSPAMTWKEYALHRHLAASCLRRRGIDGEFVALALDDHAVVALGDLRGDKPFIDVGEHTLGLACERVAVAATTGGVESENVALLERIIGIARRQALGILA